jgi:hypothetical protein
VWLSFETKTSGRLLRMRLMKKVGCDSELGNAVDSLFLIIREEEQL